MGKGEPTRILTGSTPNTDVGWQLVGAVGTGEAPRGTEMGTTKGVSKRLQAGELDMKPRQNSGVL